MIAPLLATLFLSAIPGDPCVATDATGRVPADSPRFAVTEVEPGWCMQGIDLAGTVGPRAHPGRMMVVRPRTGAYLTFYQSRPFRSNRDWVKVGDTIAAAAPANGAFNEVMIQYFGQSLIAVSVNPAWRVGNAICSSETGPITYYMTERRRLGTQDTLGRDIVRGMQMSKRFASSENRTLATTCVTAFAAEGGYRLRFHDSRGRMSPSTDDFYASARMEIVPTGDLEAYRPVNPQ